MVATELKTLIEKERESHTVELVVSTTREASRQDYKVEVVRSDISWDTVVSFSSTKNRVSLLRELAQVVMKSQDPSPLVFYTYGDGDVLEDYLDSIEVMAELDSEVRAFTLLLTLNEQNPHAGDLAKNLLLAQSHVERWKNRTLETTQDKRMYFDPLKSQWGAKTWSALTSANKTIVSHCEEEDYRDLLVFLSIFVDFFSAGRGARSTENLQRRVSDLVEESKKAELPKESSLTFLDFPIEFPEFRDYLKTLTLQDLVFLRAAIEWDSPTAKSSVKICESVIKGARLDMSFSALSATLTAIDRAVTGPRESFAVSKYTQLCNLHCQSLELLELLEHYFLNLEEKVSVVTAYKIVSSVLTYTRVWTSHYSTAGYIAGELFRATGSSRVTIDILKEVTHHRLTPSLRAWEAYFTNWELVKDVSPVLAFAVLEVE